MRKLLPAAEDVVRHAYDQTVTRAARLAAYGVTGETAGLGDEITTRQTLLAIDDLVHLAISARRITDALGLLEVTQGIHLSKVVFSRDQARIATFRVDGQVPLRTVLNKLVHSTHIEIVNYGFQLLPGLSQDEAIGQILEPERHRLVPTFLVRAENGPLLAFQIAALCQAVDQLVEAAANEARASGLYLENIFE